MSEKIFGNKSGLTVSELRIVEKLYRRRIEPDELLPYELGREVLDLADKLNRRIGLLITRDGKISEVILGKRDILYLPDLGRYRLGTSRLRRLRLVFTDLTRNNDHAVIPTDIYTDLEKLRLDAVIGVRQGRNKILASYAVLTDPRSAGTSTRTQQIPDLARDETDFEELMDAVESDLAGAESLVQHTGPQALLVSVSDRPQREAEASLDELRELARTAGIKIAGTMMQRRTPDPKSFLGTGKLEEVTLKCLQLGADYVIFDSELRPSQWKNVTKATDLKVLDRSMVILDIFAQRASSSEGRLQVELAQLKYNLPRLTELDSGLSRLTGGIGGRGPGETKLEIGRRVVRDRISDLERRIDQLKVQRGVKKKRRVEQEIPLVALVGYTNVGKSTLFNALTKSTVLVENKLFATLDPAKRRIGIVDPERPEIRPRDVIMSDTVGFIRDLPAELFNAFRATLEEIGDASLIVHVLDGSDPLIEERRAAVNAILEELHFGGIKQITVINKIDLITPEAVGELRQQYDGIYLSAVRREGVTALAAAIGLELGAVNRSKAAAADDRDTDPLESEIL